MKKLVFIFIISGSLSILSCKNANHTDDITTQMPDSGYKTRTDSTSFADSITDTKDKGAVGVDTIANGQATISGATSDTTKK